MSAYTNTRGLVASTISAHNNGGNNKVCFVHMYFNMRICGGELPASCLFFIRVGFGHVTLLADTTILARFWLAISGVT